MKQDKSVPVKGKSIKVKSRRHRTGSLYDNNDKKVPCIRLSGRWLEDCGFEVGSEVIILCENQRLVIMKA